MTINEIINEARARKVADMAQALPMSKVREVARRHDIRIRSKRDLAEKLIQKWSS